MNMERILSSENTNFLEVFQIYEDSFPDFEKRYLQHQKAVLMEENYYFYVIKGENNEILGLFMYWKTNEFIYIEHLAILESARGQNLGSKVLEEFINNSNLPIILEIDLPIDDISIRRERFYKRLGFYPSETKHIHMPYRHGYDLDVLKILSIPQISDELYNNFYKYLKNNIMKYSAYGENEI